MTKANEPQKIPAHVLLALVRRSVESGSYRFSLHAQERLQERSVTLPEVSKILRTGNLEPSKDKLHETHGTWNYALRGETVDLREIRLVFTVASDGILIVTVIDLSGKSPSHH